MTRTPGQRVATAVAAIATSALATACAGPQNALDPRGPAAARIADLWWVMLALAAAVCLVVIVMLVMAVRRSVARREGRPAREIDGARLVWAGGVIVPAVILVGVLVLSFRVSTLVYPRISEDPTAVTVEVIGHQYWWEVRYPDHGVTTANEIHLPTDTPVVFRVSAPDVIHSFWVPKLQGKIDMIPGQVHTLHVRVDEPGRFRGQCAEFCGEGHALMAVWVTAVEPGDFLDWLERQRPSDALDPRQEPAATTLAGRGREVFFAAGCAGCHATRGAPLPAAAGQPGPDLSRVAARSTLAAGTLPNTAEARRRWITDPSAIKPGALMPATSLPRREMDALLAYLETLR